MGYHDPWATIFEGIRQAMGIVLDTFIFGLLVFLVAYILWHLKPTLHPIILDTSSAIEKLFECTIVFDDRVSCIVTIRGITDERKAKEMCNAIDKALLEWRLHQQFDTIS